MSLTYWHWGSPLVFRFDSSVLTGFLRHSVQQSLINDLEVRAVNIQRFAVDH